MMKKIIPTALLLVTPLFFAPFNINFFTTNKLLFVVVVAMVMLVMTGVEHLKTKKHTHRSSFFTLSLALFWAAMGLNILLTREGRVEGLVGKGALFLTLPIITYLISTTKKSAKNLSLALMGLITAGTVLALHGIMQLVVLVDVARLPAWMQSIVFTPAGSPLILIVTVVIALVATLTWAIKENKLTKKTSLFTAAGVQLAALVAYGFMLAQGDISIQLLPWKAGWALTLDSLKNVRELFFGVGLANFPALFTQAKPTFLTQTDLWTTIFQTSSNEAFQMLTTTGVLGFGSFVLFIIASLKASSKLDKSPQSLALKLALIATILSFVFLPASIIGYTILFTLAGLVVANTDVENRKEINLPGYASIVTAVALAAVVITTGYFSYRVYAAEYYMRQAQQAFAQNDAEGMYVTHIRAVQLMPRMADYRISLSQINMTLASSLSQLQIPNPETGEQVELTDQQREQISTLIQRAIEQGQVAAQLRPSLYSSWQNLGGIYRNLINVAQGAEEFAIQYIGQAIAKDPANPLLRIEYGGLFYQLSQLVEDEETQVNLTDQAITQFQTAIRLRPTYANAYYNLANAFDKKGSYRLAYQAMTQALANLEPDSPDYQTAQNQLLELERKLPQAPAQQPAEVAPQQPGESQLQQPAPLSSPLPGGPVELPEIELPEAELVEVDPTTESTTSASPISEPAQ